ncbi:MAG: CRISPR-associated helicase Cas3' [Candidatus Methanomethylicaceae archaeon]
MSEHLCEHFYSHKWIELKAHLVGVGELCRRYAAPAADPKIYEVAEIIGKCHDLGKYTSFFQRHLLGERVQGSLSKHSRLSAILTSWFIIRKLGDPFLAGIGFLCVDSHHGDLKSLDYLSQESEILGEPLIMEQVGDLKKNIRRISEEFEEIGLQECEISDFIENFDDNLSKVRQTLKLTASSRYKLDEKERWRAYYNTLLLFSSLVDADKKDAGRVGEKSWGGSLAEDSVSKYYQSKFSNAYPSKINMLRREIFSEADGRLNELAGIAPRILTITAPTGSGKTLLGLHAALKLSKQGGGRILYCLPYINIIEQTHGVFQDVISTHYGKDPDISILLKHHHLFFPTRESLPEEIPLEKLLLLTDSWESGIVVTTFEQLMRSLVGCKNSSLKKFHNIAGSTLILDEVQAIPLEYWRLVRDVLLFLAENFGIRIILMTATMPAIFKDKGVELLNRPGSYFKHLARTVLVPTKKSVNAEEFADFFISNWRRGESALLVLNTVPTSKRVYRAIAERLKGEVATFGSSSESELADPTKVVLAYLSTSIIPKERKERVERLKELLKEKRSVILVSTQVVEAGVDLDFDVAFRDLAPLDSIIQVAGRCNRNWRNPWSPVYILRVVDDCGREDSKKIYGKILPWLTSELLAKRERIRECELAGLIEEYYRDVSYRMNVEKDQECTELLKRIKSLDFQGLARFSLIKEENIPKVPVYIEFDEEAKRLLKELGETLKNLEEADISRVFELKATLRKLRAEMENYIVEVFENEERLKSLNPVIPKINFLLVRSEEVPAFYDAETGFKATKDERESFLAL